MLYEKPKIHVYSYFEGNLPNFIPLTEMAREVKTVNGSATYAVDQFNRTHYIKAEPNQFRQLRLLQRIGVGTPKLISRSNGNIATSYAGEAMNNAMTGENSPELLRRAGVTLRDIHDRLNSVYISEADLNIGFKTSAHVVDCFFYKSSGLGSQMSEEVYREHKKRTALNHAQLITALPPADLDTDNFIPLNPDLPQHLQQFRDEANEIAGKYLVRLRPYATRYDPLDNIGESQEKAGTFLTIPDKQIIFGDYKPENLLVMNGYKQIRVIDPVITRGSLSFDLAKFSSRVLLEGALSGQPASLEAFFKGYGMYPDPDIKLYGPFTFNDLVTIDQLNILRSYFSRYGHKKGYRFVEALGDKDFCKRLTSQFQRLTGSVSAARDSLFYL